MSVSLRRITLQSFAANRKVATAWTGGACGPGNPWHLFEEGGEAADHPHRGVVAHRQQVRMSTAGFVFLVRARSRVMDYHSHLDDRFELESVHKMNHGGGGAA
jgi:hypothetical protein